MVTGGLIKPMRPGASEAHPGFGIGSGTVPGRIRFARSSELRTGNRRGRRRDLRRNAIVG